MKKIALAAALSLSCLAAHAVQIEFQVPVELRHIDRSATHVDVICGSYAGGRYLNSQKVLMPLQDAGTHRSFSGVVKVVVAWPGSTVPTGKYRCAMAMKTAGDYMDFERLPAAVGSRAVTLVEGDFGDYQAAAPTKSTKDLAPLTKPAPKILK
jgi:hypothetical protein